MLANLNATALQTHVWTTLLFKRSEIWIELTRFRNGTLYLQAHLQHNFSE